MTSKDSAEQAENRIYELGFHLVPTIAEEKLPTAVTAVKDTLEANGAVFIAEDFPKIKHLAYQMTKIIGAKHLKFDTAYFGWIKFEMNPESVDAVKKIFMRADDIVRFLIVKTVRESTLAVIKPPMYRSEAKPIPTVANYKKDGEVKSPISEAELDKTIDALVVE